MHQGACTKPCPKHLCVLIHFTFIRTLQVLTSSPTLQIREPGKMSKITAKLSRRSKERLAFWANTLLHYLRDIIYPRSFLPSAAHRSSDCPMHSWKRDHAFFGSIGPKHKYWNRQNLYDNHYFFLKTVNYLKMSKAYALPPLHMTLFPPKGLWLCVTCTNPHMTHMHRYSWRLLIEDAMTFYTHKP